MNFSSLFIKRPVMTILLTLWLMMMSIIAYQKLPINALPKIEMPVIVVNAGLSGATPETMAQAVALPLEQQFSSIPGLDQITSTSAQEATQIVLEFNLNTDINAAAQDVATAISTAQSRLPSTMTMMPNFKKVNPADQPVIVLAMRSSSMLTWQLTQYCENLVIPKLSMLPDIARVLANGKQSYAVRIEVDPWLMATHQLSLSQIAHDIRAANVNIASGVLQGDTHQYQIAAQAQLQNAAEFSKVLINNNPHLRLEDIATVTDSVDNLYTAAFYGNDPSLILTIQRQPGSNSIEVAQNVTKLVPQLRELLPQNIDLDVIVDRTESTQEAIFEVKLTSLITIILVVLVIYLFLQSLEATFIPSITLPLSILLTFLVMYLLGFSLNNMTLLAITLSIGFIIDDAIVVLENIMVHREKGKKAQEAALDGAKEITFTVLSMTLSLIAVFIPIVFMQGVVGRFLYEFAMTIVIAILASGVVSLSVIPMLSQFLKGNHQALTTTHKHKALRLFNQFYQWMENSYTTSLEKIFVYKPYVLPFLALLIILNVALFSISPKGFIPNEDTGLIYGVTEVPSEASFDETLRAEKELIAILAKHPDIESYNATIGRTSSTIASNEGRFFIVLKPLSQRKPIVDVIKELRKQIDVLPSLSVSMQAVQNLRIGGKLSKSQYQYTLQSQNYNDLTYFTQKLEEHIAKLPGVVDVNSDLKLSSLKASIKVDRDKAKRLGVSMNDITDTLQYGFADAEISSIYTDSDTYPVIMTFKKNETRSIHDLDKVYLQSVLTKKAVPLSAMATVEFQNAPLTVNHLNRLPSATLSFNLSAGKSLGDTVKEITAIEEQIALPASITRSFQGAAKAFQSSNNGQMFLILGAIITVYIILGMLYESFKHPLTIITGLPSAGLGAILFLLLLGFEMDVIAMVGIVLLIGIVKKNAIMMIDYAQILKTTQNASSYEAITAACKRRFRPIMMTTFAALMGAVPIALWNGSGSELRRPLGICIIGGLLVSQWLTLYITPLFYVWIDEFKKPTLKKIYKVMRNIRDYVAQKEGKGL